MKASKRVPPVLKVLAAVAVTSLESEAVQISGGNKGLRSSEQRGLEWTPPSYACSPSNCPTSTHLCLANPNHPQHTTDDTCTPCQGSQTYWPCDVSGLCYCWDTANGEKRIPPAPTTKSVIDGGALENHSMGNYIWKISDVDPCDILTEEVFKTLAPKAVAPYTYAGFCEAVRLYNVDHPTEGVFNMGSELNQRMELAAFFGNALHESDEFKAGREYLMCADQIIHGGETYCKPCDVGSFDWDTMKCSASLASEGRAFNSYCQSNLLPPDGCECDDVYENPEIEGYVKADQVYFGRGSIQLSWNYNFIRASVALTGAPQTFCQRPDLVATKEEYAWGAGLFYWMENIKNDKSCHQSVLMNSDFGETLDNINGGLECPSDDHGWHGKAVQLRLNRYCRASNALGLNRLLSLDGCMDMDKKMQQCLEEGNCDDCKSFVGKIGLIEGGSDENLDQANNTEEYNSDVSYDVQQDEHDVTELSDESSSKPTNRPSQITSTTTEITQNNRPPRTFQPSNRPSKRPTRVPRTPKQSSSPSKAPMTSPLVNGAVSANQFALYGVTVIKHDDSVNKVKETEKIDTFAVTSHSKASDYSASVSTRTKRPTMSPITNEPSVHVTLSSPTKSPVFAELEDPGEMMNWGLTQLVDEKQASDAESPTKDNPIDVQAIEFRPPPKLDVLLEPDEKNAILETEIPVNDLERNKTDSLNDVDTLMHVFRPPPKLEVFLEPDEKKTILDEETQEDDLQQNKTDSLNDVETVMKISEYQESSQQYEVIQSKEIGDQPKDKKEPLKENSFSTQDVGMILDMSVQSLPDEVDKSSGIISGRVWMDEKDIGLRGILVDLFQCENDEWIQGTRTSSSGDYIFEDIEEGEYYVRVTSANTYKFLADSKNNNVDSEGKSACIEISPAAQSLTINAGLAKPIITSTLDVSDVVSKSNIDTVPVAILDTTDEIPYIDPNCRGQPCTEGDGTYCRSKYSFCGAGEDFCNKESQWTPECGTETPTIKPSNSPTTGQPTFVFDMRTQCDGEPCTDGDGTWCRSEIGFCGSGNLYCNMGSIWIPECILEPTRSPSSMIGVDSPTLLQTESEEPTAAPYLMPIGDSLGFSSFALPTLTEIKSKQQNSHTAITGHERTSIKDEELLSPVTDGDDDENYIEGNVKETKQHSVTDSSWYDKYAYLDSLTTSSADVRSIPSPIKMSAFFGLIVSLVL